MHRCASFLPAWRLNRDRGHDIIAIAQIYRCGVDELQIFELVMIVAARQEQSDYTKQDNGSHAGNCPLFPLTQASNKRTIGMLKTMKLSYFVTCSSMLTRDSERQKNPAIQSRGTR
ncbi:hypothetical protein D3C85_1119050 [compost metagenome]